MNFNPYDVAIVVTIAQILLARVAKPFVKATYAR